MPNIATLDIEASGIHPESYPIEIGVILPNGDAYCNLIKPASTWTYWDDDAEKIHGISQDELIQYGKEVLEVARELNHFLKDITVYSDCWLLDQPWLTTLFQQTSNEPTFKLMDIMYIMAENRYEQLTAAKSEAASHLQLKRHRATNDAPILQLAYSNLHQQSPPD